MILMIKLIKAYKLAQACKMSTLQYMYLETQG